MDGENDVKLRKSEGILYFCAALALFLALFLPACTAHKDVADSPAAVAGNGESEPPPEGLGAATADAGGTLPEGAPTGMPDGDSDAVWSFDVDSNALVSEEVYEEEEEKVIDPAALATEALEACESARIFWEEGEIDEALTTLDNAYALMLQIPEDDPVFFQEKENLRHLITRRVVEIYRSRLTSASDMGSEIPIEMNKYVEREIKSFQTGERQFFMDSYRRSGMYRPMIVRMMREAGMPEEMSWLPLVESGFKTRALSRARALGMWQFISSTGYRYGLSRSHWIRMDPEEATRGAIEYLTELHAMFGDWMTALAGYNCGENRVMKVIRRQQNGYMDHFWDVFEQLPRETARYVPRFQATLLIVNDPQKYGFDLPDPLPPVTWEPVPVGRHVKLDDLDRTLGLDKGTLAALNPELRRGVTPDTAYELKVPPAAAPGFQAKLDSMSAYVPPKDQYVVHRVRSGETLSTIARRYGSSVNKIVSANNLRSRNRIRAGQRLKIPSRYAPTRTGGSSRPVAVATGPAAEHTHVVRSGDSLWKLASRYGTTVDRIKRDNGLRNDRLTVGQKLKVNTGIPPGSRTYAVRRGDTLGKIAKRHRVSLNSVLQANGLSSRSTIYPGQMLVIPN